MNLLKIADKNMENIKKQMKTYENILVYWLLFFVFFDVCTLHLFHPLLWRGSGKVERCESKSCLLPLRREKNGVAWVFTEKRYRVLGNQKKAPLVLMEKMYVFL